MKFDHLIRFQKVDWAENFSATSCRVPKIQKKLFIPITFFLYQVSKSKTFNSNSTFMKNKISKSVKKKNKETTTTKNRLLYVLCCVAKNKTQNMRQGKEI